MYSAHGGLTLAVVLSLGTMACATYETAPLKGAPPAAIQAKANTPPPPGSGRAIVFGKWGLVKTESGMDKLSRFLEGEGKSYLIVYDHASGSTSKMAIDPKGWFYWEQAPGTYRILGYAHHRNAQYESLQIDTEYSVADGEQARYIGHLEFNDDRGRLLVRDAQDEAFGDFSARYPTLETTPVKAPMKFSSAPGTYASVQDICAAGWGLKCGTRHRGVEPLSPTMSSTLAGITKIESLTPRLRWSPAAGDDISYDVIVWEAAVFVDPVTTIRKAMRGPIHLYREGVKQAEVEVDVPLKPKTQYFWSVRLRRDDKVSTWSTTGDFTFLVVIVASSYGKMFEFETK